MTDLGELGRMFIVGTIARREPISRRDLQRILGDRKDLRFRLGGDATLADFLNWCVMEGVLIEQSGTLEVSAMGRRVLTRLRSSAVERALLGFEGSPGAAIARASA